MADREGGAAGPNTAAPRPIDPGIPWPRGFRASGATAAGSLRVAIQVALTYRGRMVLWVLSGFFPLLLLAVWLTVAAQSGPPEGWTTRDFVSYYAAATVVYQMSSQHVIWQWDADLRSGDFSMRLLRPQHPFWQYVTGDAGQRLVLGAGLVPVFVVVALLVPAIDYSLSAVELLLVFASVLLAWALSLMSALTFALVGFWSTQTTNIWMLWWGVGSFASGWVAPLELMPTWLRDAAFVLPFRYMLGFPAELLAGRVPPDGVLPGFAIGVGWAALFALVYLVAWRPSVRRYQAVAG